MSEFDELREFIAGYEVSGNPEISLAVEELSWLLECRDALVADLEEMEEAWRSGDPVEKAVSDPARQSILEDQIEEYDDEIRAKSSTLLV